MRQKRALAIAKAGWQGTEILRITRATRRWVSSTRFLMTWNKKKRNTFFFPFECKLPRKCSRDGLAELIAIL